MIIIVYIISIYYISILLDDKTNAQTFSHTHKEIHYEKEIHGVTEILK